MVSYSHSENVLTEVHTTVSEPPFTARIYPNPAQNQITVSTDYKHGAVSVMMLNTLGQMVMYFTVEGERTIDVSRLPKGVYTLQLLGGSLVTEKLIVR